LPGDDEISGTMRRDIGMELIILGVCIDLELSAARRTARIVVLAEDAPGIAVLIVARPRDHESAPGLVRAAAAIRDVSLATMVVVRLRVHLEFTAGVRA